MPFLGPGRALSGSSWGRHSVVGDGSPEGPGSLAPETLEQEGPPPGPTQQGQICSRPRGRCGQRVPRPEAGDPPLRAGVGSRAARTLHRVWLSSPLPLLVFAVCLGASAVGLGGTVLTFGLFRTSPGAHLWPLCLLAPRLGWCGGPRGSQGPADVVSRADVGLPHGLRDPEPAAASGQTHGSLQAYLVAHRDIEGLAAAVVALQGHAQDGPRASYQRK